MTSLFGHLLADRTRESVRRTSRAFRPAGDGLEDRLQMTASPLGTASLNLHIQTVPNPVNIVPLILDPINQEYQALGGANSFLGLPTSPELSGPNGGIYRDYQGGAIYYTAATGAHEVHGAIYGHYLALGGPSSFLGYPTSDESAAANGGRFSAFQGGRIYWSSATGAHEVHGAILGEYLALGGSGSLLGFPTSDESPGPNGGRFNTFQYGNVDWTPSTGAHEVHGAILTKYLSLGGAGGFLGYPTHDEAAAGAGRVSTFQYGNVYWSASTGSHEVHGAILGKYLSLGGANSFLGLPTSDELALNNGGRENMFQQGRIYWSPSTGAHEVHGAILSKYVNSEGGATGILGYPTTDEQDRHDGVPGRVSFFQHGFITWNSQNGAVNVVIYP
jgi:uncharacterized protein with LGFP repeats